MAMTNYHEILRLKSLGVSERNIALSCSCSRNTVSKVVKRFTELGLNWTASNSKTNSEWQTLLFPKANEATIKRSPNYDYIRNELLKNGVSKKLLWAEYMEECRLNVVDH